MCPFIWKAACQLIPIFPLLGYQMHLNESIPGICRDAHLWWEQEATGGWAWLWGLLWDLPSTAPARQNFSPTLAVHSRLNSPWIKKLSLLWLSSVQTPQQPFMQSWVWLLNHLQQPAQVPLPCRRVERGTARRRLHSAQCQQNRGCSSGLPTPARQDSGKEQPPTQILAGEFAEKPFASCRTPNSQKLGY